MLRLAQSIPVAHVSSSIGPYAHAQSSSTLASAGRRAAIADARTTKLLPIAKLLAFRLA